MATVASPAPPLPRLAWPWRRAFQTGSQLRIEVLHLTDPVCPWAYSFEPTLRALEARYGDQLRFRSAMIGLAEPLEEEAARAPALRREIARAFLGFRRFGMPIAPHLRERSFGSEPSCRLVTAAALQDPLLGEAALRALRLATFTTDLTLDEDAALAAVAATVAGLDAERAVDELRSSAVSAAYERDWKLAREPAAAALTLGRAAGTERYAAPTLILRNESCQEVVVPGFQPLEAVEVALVNLEPRLQRLPVPALAELIEHYPAGLTSQEAARLLADGTEEVDRAATERKLLALAAEGSVTRTELADDALWAPT